MSGGSVSQAEGGPQASDPYWPSVYPCFLNFDDDIGSGVKDKKAAVATQSALVFVLFLVPADAVVDDDDDDEDAVVGAKAVADADAEVSFPVRAAACEFASGRQRWRWPAFCRGWYRCSSHEHDGRAGHSYPSAAPPRGRGVRKGKGRASAMRARHLWTANIAHEYFWGYY